AADGVAFNAATSRWRGRPKALLSGNQSPVGVWTGKRYIVFAGSQAAAYNPAHNRWRRIAAAPSRAAAAVWNGSSVLVTTGSRNVVAYDPVKDRWLKLPRLPVGRVGQVAVWDGARLLVWGGARGGAYLTLGA